MLKPKQNNPDSESPLMEALQYARSRRQEDSVHHSSARPAIRLNTTNYSEQLDCVKFLQSSLQANVNTPNLDAVLSDDLSDCEGLEEKLLSAIIRDLANNGLLQIITAKKSSRVRILSGLNFDVRFGEGYVGASRKIAVIDFVRMLGEAVEAGGLAEVILSDHETGKSINLRGEDKATPALLDFIKDTIPNQEARFDKNSKIVNCAYTDNSPLPPIKTEPSLTPTEFLSLLDREGDTLSIETREKLARVFGWILEDTFKQLELERAPISSENRPKYRSKRGQSNDGGMKGARWLVEHWGDLLRLQAVTQKDMENPMSGDPKLLEALRNAIKRNGLLENPELANLLTPIGILPPYETLGDIIPTGSGMNQLDQIRASIEKVATLSIQTTLIDP